MKASRKHILNTVLGYYGITEKEISSSDRRTNLVRARQMYCYLCDQHTSEILSSIGLLINRDHSTVLYSISKTKVEKEIYSHLKIEITEITEAIFKTALVIENVDLLKLTENYTASFL